MSCGCKNKANQQAQQPQSQPQQTQVQQQGGNVSETKGNVQENVKKIIQSGKTIKYNQTDGGPRSLTFATPDNDNKEEKPLIKTLESFTTIQSSR